MPLIHGSSRKAISSNIEREVEDGKPHRQAVAIALDVARRAKERAKGGKATSKRPMWTERSEGRQMHVGPVMSAVPGRTDHHPIMVPSGSYVLPADHVAHLGEDNTLAGMSVLNKLFGNDGPYDSGTMPLKHGVGAPSAPHSSLGGAHGHGDHQPVEVNVAGGEYIIHPDIIIKKFGSLDRGHKALDAWVKSTKKKHLKTLRKLPGPVES